MLLTKEYEEQLYKLHTSMEWGRAAAVYIEIIRDYLLPSGSLLDYGSGGGGFQKALRNLDPDLADNLDIIEYDPAWLHLNQNNIPCDFVLCVDVLEHVEPLFIDAVLDDLERCTLKKGFFSISTRPAKTLLPDGRNAHLIQKPAEWWIPKIESRFNIIESAVTQATVVTIVESKN